jgi:branched-chain amino acid transport system ATP-binding protein
MPKEAMLQVENATLLFGGLRALDNISLELRQGEILGLIGPNGAGKTTLFNVIAGVYRPTQGRVLYRGQEITALRPHDRCHLGIARTFQITKPFMNMSLLENVAVGAYYGKPGKLTQAQSLEKAAEILDRVGLGAIKDGPASGLTLGQRKKLELCRALSTSPKVLLLDEVVAGLTPTEVGEMVEVIRQINATGVTILIIEHVLKAVMAVSQRVMVLHFGKLLAQGTPEEIVHNDDVIRAYLGGMAQHA